jgi:hypothetical protein
MSSPHQEEIMSLIKLYGVGCEGPTLALRLGTAPLLAGHTSSSVIGFDSPARARRAAKRAGWTRVRREIPLGNGAGTTMIAFDLCPGCTAVLGGK